MIPLLQLFFAVCRLRASPADVPASRALAALCLAMYAALSLTIASIEQDLASAMLSAAVDLVMLVALAYLSLWVRDLPQRVLQTVTALAGTGAFFNFLGMPLMVLLHQMPEGGNAALSLLLLALIVWNIAVIGHILRHAMAIPMWGGVGIAVLYVYTSIRVMSALFVAGS